MNAEEAEAVGKTMADLDYPNEVESKLLEEAGRREFDLVYFWRLNRFSREGIKQTIRYLELLEGYGVKFNSYTEHYLDTENELIRHMLLGVLSYFAEQQAVEISENTKAGLERAKKQGKRLGRPPLFPETKNYSHLGKNKIT